MSLKVSKLEVKLMWDDCTGKINNLFKTHSQLNKDKKKHNNLFQVVTILLYNCNAGFVIADKRKTNGLVHTSHFWGSGSDHQIGHFRERRILKYS